MQNGLPETNGSCRSNLSVYIMVGLWYSSPTETNEEIEMSKFFEERKFYKFGSEYTKNKFTNNGAYGLNTAFAKYVGMNPFEVEIDYHNGRERVSRIRVYDEMMFVDPSKITGNPDDANAVLFNSSGFFGHEFDYFIEVVRPLASVSIPENGGPKPVKATADWKVLIIKNGKIEVHSRHNTKEQADRQAEELLTSSFQQVCYIVKGDVTQATTTKQLKLETI